jgi:hypothetical protein
MTAQKLSLKTVAFPLALRVALVTVVLVVVALVAELADSDALSPDPSAVSPDAGRTPRAAQLTVSSQTLGPPLAPGFVGLSIEFPALRAYAGADPRAVNPVLEQLIRNLAPGQRPVLRIGGDSTDSTWWPAPGVPRPSGVSYGLTSAWLAGLRALARDLRARLIVGANLAINRPSLTVAEARALIAGLGRETLQALELGNEPDNYAELPWYRTQGRGVYARRGEYGFASFTREFSQLRRRLPAVPLAGPTVGSYGWLRHLRGFLAAEPTLSLVTFHRYPLNRCFTEPGSPTYPTVPNLLSPAASAGLVAGIAPYAALARRRGLTFRVDELNSVACGGKTGVSNTFASALWVLDTLFETAKAGADGVNIHTFPGAAYAPFSFVQARRRWSAAVRPEYYGLLMFARAAPPGSQLLRLAGTQPHGFKAWATLTPTHTIQVLLINKNMTHPIFVSVRLPGAQAPAILQRLQAASAHATAGITIAGQSFATPTYTGLPSGRRRETTVSPASNRYTLSLGQASAALLTIPAGG